MRWVRVVYIMDLSLFSRVLSEHTIHNKSYNSPLSSGGVVGEAVPLFILPALGLGERLSLSLISLHWGCGRGLFSLQKERGGI